MEIVQTLTEAYLLSGLAFGDEVYVKDKGKVFYYTGDQFVSLDLSTTTLTKSIELSSAQILTIGSTPIELLPAPGTDKYYDEISFVLEYNGSSKTFYIRNKEKTRSNIDVTGQLEYIDGEPSMQSMINLAIEILKVA